MCNNEIVVVKYAGKDVVLNWFDRPEATDLLQEVFSGYKDQKVFVNWISVFDGKDPEGKIKKPKKVPFNPYYEGNASVDKPKTWVSLTSTINDGLWNTKKINGIGIVLNNTDLTVIDVDKITKDDNTPITDQVADLSIIKELQNKFDSYTEISPSGKGIHIFIKGKLDIADNEEAHKNGEFKYDGYIAKYELFDGVTFSKGRFVTITGNIVGNTKEIKPVDLGMLRDFAVNGGNIKKADQKYKADFVAATKCDMKQSKDDVEILDILKDYYLYNPEEVLFTDAHGSNLHIKINDSGYEILPDDNSDVKITYPSPSEYDAALMGVISFLTKNPEQMERVFKSSKYFRCFRGIRDKYKCNRKDYMERTITSAISWSSSHPDHNPFRYVDYDSLNARVHNNTLTDKEFVEYLIHKGVLDHVRMLCVGKSDEDNQFIKYNQNIGCWDIQHRSVSAFTDVLYDEVGRLISIIEIKRAKEYEELQQKIAAVEAKGEQWVGSKELPSDPVYTYLTRLYNAKGINSLINVIKKLSSIQTFMEDYDNVDQCGDYLYFEDCKLDLNTGEWLDISPADMNSKSCSLKVKPYLNPDGSIKTNGTVQSYIHDFFIPTIGKNKGMYQEGFYKMFMSALGSSLFGYVKEKYFYFMYGEGNTGKSVLMDTIAAAMGGDTDRGFYMPLDPAFFTADRGGNNDTLYHSKGRRFGVGSEMESVMKLKNDTVKYYTGNENIRVSAKYMRQISFKMSLTNFIETNELPFISNGLDAAMCNRIAIISCEHVVAEKDMDKNLKKKLLADIGGLIWLLKTASDIYRSEGLVIPDEALTLKKEYVKELSTIEQFAQEFLEFTGNENDKIPSGNLYEEYRRFYTNIEYGLGKQEKYIESENTFLKSLRKAAKSRGVDLYSKQERDKTHPKGRMSFTYGIKYIELEPVEDEIPDFFK